MSQSKKSGLETEQGQKWTARPPAWFRPRNIVLGLDILASTEAGLRGRGRAKILASRPMRPNFGLDVQARSSRPRPKPIFWHRG